MKVVCDTSPLIALHDASEPLHAMVRDLSRRDDVELLLPDPVICETEWLLRDRLSPGAALVFLEDVAAGGYERISLDDALFSRALAYDRAYEDLDLGLADASVMAVAEFDRAPILTFDFRDFRAAPPLRGGWWELVVSEETIRRYR